MTDVAIADRAQVDRAFWDRSVDLHEYGWWFHRSEWLDYALAYTPLSVDKSTVMLQKVLEMPQCVYAQPMALVPMVMDPEGKPVYGGQMTPAPLVADEDDAVLHNMPVLLRPGQEAPEDMPVDVDLVTHYTHVVDLLDGDDGAHWKRVRKSYHSLIRKAEREYGITVHSNIPDAKAVVLMEHARHLHILAAGRETRSIKTWDYMTCWLTAGHGVLALAQTEAGATVGFAYAIRYKDWSYWASGATIVPNVQHALQWQLMHALRCDEKTRYYEVGHDADEQDGQKAKGIAFFKSGLGGSRWPVVEMKTCAL